MKAGLVQQGKASAGRTGNGVGVTSVCNLISPFDLAAQLSRNCASRLCGVANLLSNLAIGGETYGSQLGNGSVVSSLFAQESGALPSSKSNKEKEELLPSLLPFALLDESTHRPRTSFRP